MKQIREKLPNVRTALQFVYDGITKHGDRMGFKLNMNYFFRTHYTSVVTHDIHNPDDNYRVLNLLEGDAGVCAIQEICGRALMPEDFKGMDTAQPGCNPVLMLSEVLQLEYNDLITFLYAIGHAMRGEMVHLINYVHPYGFPYKGGPAVDKGKIKYPSLYLRNNSVHSQLPQLHNYIQYLKLVEK